MRIYTEEKTIHKTSHHQNGFGTIYNAATAQSTTLSPSSSNYSSASSIGPNQQLSTTSTVSTTFEVHNGGCINRVNIPMVFNKNRTNISMYKFINTKGKQATKDSHYQNGFRSNQYFNDGDYILKPPKYVTSNHNFYKKRISAIDKIQEELKEMKLREDELRCQRGLSYPNLSSICDEDFNSDDQTIESSEENKDSFHSRCSSNPDILSGGGLRDTFAIDINTSSTTLTSDTDSDCGLKIGGPRRKIPLIAIWEQKIQENENSGEVVNNSNSKSSIITN